MYNISDMYSVWEVLVSALLQEKETKGMQIGEKEGKLYSPLMTRSISTIKTQWKYSLSAHKE